VLRCWQPTDAPRLKEAVDASLDHLQPWMPWAVDEPQSVEEKVELLRRFRGQFDLGQDYVLGILSRDESDVLGGSGFHPRAGDDAFEIGYWIRASHTGQGLGTEATAAITRVGFELCGVDRIEIRVEPQNERSMAIPRKLGFREEARLRRRLRHPGSPAPRDAVIFTLFHDEYEGSPAAGASVEAYDAIGTRLL
jgi:RimJ/RimL family protein N-acetyltransferase